MTLVVDEAPVLVEAEIAAVGIPMAHRWVLQGNGDAVGDVRTIGMGWAWKVVEVDLPIYSKRVTLKTWVE